VRLGILTLTGWWASAGRGFRRWGYNRMVPESDGGDEPRSAQTIRKKNDETPLLFRAGPGEPPPACLG
jgi:hypothetical protein